MVRTTLNLDPAVLSELRRRATKRQKSLGEVASELLECQFAADRKAVSWPPPGWITHGLGVRMVEVDLSSNAALWDFFDSEGDSASE